MSKQKGLAELNRERRELLVALKDSVRTLEKHNYFYDASNIKRAIESIKEQKKAHEAWLEEREEVFKMIDNMEKDIVDSVDKKEGHPRYWVDTLERIRAFIEKGE